MSGRIVLVALLGLLALAAPAVAAPALSPIGSFTQPVYVTAPPADPHRLFVVEKAGVVKVIVDGGAPQVFLDIRDEVDDDGEEGLLSVGFAPDYATSRRFYAYFTAEDPSQGNGSRIKIVEFVRPEATPDAADPAARRTLVEIPHPTATNHNGGQLQVGPDGRVWAATGDGAVTPSNAQNQESLLGKMLRIDPANPSPPEIWASGLRNPWRFSFDRATGDLVIGDVGASAREEIDFAARGTAAGSNYGWPCYEGTVGPTCLVTNHTPPVFEYDSTTFGCGVVGGYVVRDEALPTLAGRYLYGDLCRSKLRSLALGTPAASGDREEALELGSLVAFGEDSCGHVYAVSIAGTVARVHDGPIAPCPEPTQPDTTAPQLSVSRTKAQRLLARKAVYVTARCDELCGLAVQSNVRWKIGGRTRKWAFPAASAVAPAGEPRRLKLRLTKAMKRALAARVARGARPLVKAQVIARDAAQNETRRTVYVRVVG
jgi:glucose/arabinose dehydrogenase